MVIVLKKGQIETTESSSSWTLHKKWSFPLRISSVNVTVASCGFSHIYWKNPYWKTSFFVQWNILTLGTGRRLNLIKLNRKRTGRLLSSICTFNLRPMFRGLLLQSQLKRDAPKNSCPENISNFPVNMFMTNSNYWRTARKGMEHYEDHCVFKTSCPDVVLDWVHLSAA